MQITFSCQKCSTGNPDEKTPQIEQIGTETFLVPTDWVGYENFPEKVPNFLPMRNLFFLPY